MNWTLEVVVVPLVDIDRSKACYADRLGFTVGHDTEMSPGNRGVEVMGADPGAVGKGGAALDNVEFVFLRDPDGNSWAVQQISARG